MKRLGSSDSLGALISICPTTTADEHSPRNNHVYSRDFQSMLDDMDEEGCVEESGHIAEKKRRLSFEQVKALEKNFEVENKLEPERKVRLAQEFGLQPRQVVEKTTQRKKRGAMLSFIAVPYIGKKKVESRRRANWEEENYNY